MVFVRVEVAQPRVEVVEPGLLRGATQNIVTVRFSKVTHSRAFSLFQLGELGVGKQFNSEVFTAVCFFRDPHLLLQD